MKTIVPTAPSLEPGFLQEEGWMGDILATKHSPSLSPALGQAPARELSFQGLAGWHDALSLRTEGLGLHTLPSPLPGVGETGRPNCKREDKKKELKGELGLDIIFKEVSPY